MLKSNSAMCPTCINREVCDPQYQYCFGSDYLPHDLTPSDVLHSHIELIFIIEK